jgi:hypothetical protein
MQVPSLHPKAKQQVPHIITRRLPSKPTEEELKIPRIPVVMYLISTQVRVGIHIRCCGRRVVVIRFAVL